MLILLVGNICVVRLINKLFVGVGSVILVWIIVLFGLIFIVFWNLGNVCCVKFIRFLNCDLEISIFCCVWWFFILFFSCFSRFLIVLVLFICWEDFCVIIGDWLRVKNVKLVIIINSVSRMIKNNWWNM